MRALCRPLAALCALSVLALPAAGLAQASGEEESKPVDWRGLDRHGPDGKKRDKPPPSPLQRLAQNAPYRVHVATSHGGKVKITDAYTLERRKVFVASEVQGLAFSTDGHWLYVAHGEAGKTAGRRVVVSAVAVRSAKARRLARVKLAKGESLAELRGHGDATAPGVTLVVGRGRGWAPGGPCGRWRGLRAVKVRTRRGKVVVAPVEGPLELRFPIRTRQVSPNTRYTVELAGALKIFGRFGGGSKVEQLNRKALPGGSFGLRWARDSRGVFVLHRRRGGCKAAKGLVAFRQPAAQFASWRRQHSWPSWRVPANVALVRGDLDHQDLTWAPDGMRLVGTRADGVVLVEPTPRVAGQHVTVVAPPSDVWPAVRGGVRGLLTGAGALRHAGILLEQGQLAAARKRLDAATAPEHAADKARLLARLQKLEAVAARRAREFGAAALETPGAATPTGR